MADGRLGDGLDGGRAVAARDLELVTVVRSWQNQDGPEDASQADTAERALR